MIQNAIFIKNNNMLLYCALLPCLLTCASSSENLYYGNNNEGPRDTHSWPMHSTTKLFSKRQAELKAGEISSLHENIPTEVKGLKATEKRVLQASHSEGGVEQVKLLPTVSTAVNSTSNQTEATLTSPKTELNKGNATQNTNTSSSGTPQITEKPSNATVPKAPSYQADLSNPGVVKRGLIVFGGFAIMAIAYFIFYRRKGKNNESNNTHGTNDTNQFRYGVLQSDDRRDNLELSRILTVESDEDEDEDLEIFDLEQKKKSLSYVNLQTNDDYLVHGSREDITDRDNLLLDIEDRNSDTLINWSSNGNKSIL